MLFYTVTFAQHKINNPILFENIGTENGLSSPTVNALFQDKSAFIWIGTEDGLCRYDGYEMIVFKTVPSDSSSISSNIITSIIADSDGGMWIGTTDGLNLYNPENETFERYYYSYSQPNSIRNNHVFKLYPSLNGLILVETLGGTLTIFDRNGVNTKHFKHQPSRQPYYRYHGLYQDSDTSIWFGGRGLGLNRINPQNGTITTYSANSERNDRKRDDDVSLIFNHFKLGWYIAGLDGLYKFSPSDSSFTKIFGTTTYSIVTDKRDNIWVGTGYGLALISTEDSSIVFFRNDPDNPSSLVNNSVNALLIDRNGNIWAGTNQGLSFLNIKGTKFTCVQRVKGDENRLSSNRVTALYEDRDKNLWIGTADAGIDVWDHNNQLIRKYNTENGKLASDKISCIYEDGERNMWIGLWAGVGFSQIDKSGRINHYSYLPDSRKVDWYNSFYEDNSGNFWIGMWGGQGLYKFDRQTKTFQTDVYVTFDIPYRNELVEIVRLNNNLFFVPISSNRLYKYSLTDEKFAYFDVFQNEESNQHITKLFNLNILRNTNLVIASNLGIHLLNSNGTNLKTYQLPNILSLTVSSDSSRIFVLTQNSLKVLDGNLNVIASNPITSSLGAVNGLYADTADRLYILSHSSLWFINDQKKVVKVCEGTWGQIGVFKHNGLVYYFNKSNIFSLNNGSVNSTFSFFDKIDTPNFSIERVVPGNNSLVLCFTNAGVYRINFVKNSVEAVDLSRLKAYSQSNINAALCISDNQLVLSLDRDVFKYDIVEGNYVKLNELDGKALSSHLITQIVGEKNGVLWAGTSDEGLNRLSPNRDTINNFRVSSAVNAIAGNDISALMFDNDSNLWIGTDNGVSIYDRRSKSMKTLDVSWPSSKVKSIAQDVYGYLWIGTEKGLVRYNSNDKTYSVYGEADGLISNSFSNAAISRSDSTLAFGTSNGLVQINPLDFFATDDDIPVHITSVNVMGRRVKSLFNSNDIIELRYDDSYFSIGVSPLNFSYPLQSKFFYKLEGLDNSWREFDGNKVFFSKLKAGRYKFYVSSKPNTNVQNLLTIVVRPPFWQRWWFKMILILTFLGVVVGYLASYIHQLKIKQQSSEFEQKLLLSQMNPHFIFNSLSAIQNYMFANRPIEAGNYLSDFSRLMRLILENSRSKEILLSKELQSLRFYLELQKLRFSEKFDYEISVSDDIAEDLVYITPMLIQPFIENSIEHGIQHKNGKGFISLDLRIEDSYVVFEIVDDGVGFEKSKEINRNRREFHQSQSTQITQERIELLSKQKRGKAIVQIIDRDATEGVSGTRVVVRIPYRLEQDRIKTLNAKR